MFGLLSDLTLSCAIILSAKPDVLALFGELEERGVIPYQELRKKFRGYVCLHQTIAATRRFLPNGPSFAPSLHPSFLTRAYQPLLRCLLLEKTDRDISEELLTGVIDKYNAFQVEGSEGFVRACEDDRRQEDGGGESATACCLRVLCDLDRVLTCDVLLWCRQHDPAWHYLTGA